MAGELGGGRESSFSRTFERWLLAEVGERYKLEQRLSNRYRRAWKSGSRKDKFDVLHFVALTQEAGGSDLIVAALGSADPELSQHALACVGLLAVRGTFLGPASVEALKELRKKLPDQTLIREVLESLRRHGWTDSQ